MTVDLLVVNYNTRHLLQRLLDMLHSDYEEGVWKLHIADNDSQDDTVAFLRDRGANYNIETVRLNQNIGYAEAINDLAFNSKSSFLAAVNADAAFTTNHVKQIVQSFADHPKAGVIGPKQMDEQYQIRHGGITWDGNKAHNPVHRGWGMRDQMDTLYRDTLPVWTVSGSLYYTRRELWDQMTWCGAYRDLYPMAKGAFLPTPMYYEETFYSVHVQHHGWEVWYDGSVDTAIHTFNASSPDRSQGKASMFSLSRDIYIRACDYHGMHHEC